MVFTIGDSMTDYRKEKHPEIEDFGMFFQQMEEFKLRLYDPDRSLPGTKGPWTRKGRGILPVGDQ